MNNSSNKSKKKNKNKNNIQMTQKEPLNIQNKSQNLKIKPQNLHDKLQDLSPQFAASNISSINSSSSFSFASNKSNTTLNLNIPTIFKCKTDINILPLGMISKSSSRNMKKHNHMNNNNLNSQDSCRLSLSSSNNEITPNINILKEIIAIPSNQSNLHLNTNEYIFTNKNNISISTIPHVDITDSKTFCNTLFPQESSISLSLASDSIPSAKKENDQDMITNQSLKMENQKSPASVLKPDEEKYALPIPKLSPDLELRPKVDIKVRPEVNPYINNDKVAENNIDSDDDANFILSNLNENRDYSRSELLSYIEWVKYHHSKVETHEAKINSLENNVLELESKNHLCTKEYEMVNHYKVKITELMDISCEFIKALEVIKNEILRYEHPIKSKPNLIKYYQERINIELNRLELGLPIYAKKSMILERIQKHQFILLIGDTGSGKSTQLPQYLFDLYNNLKLKIVSTQPRRLATQSIAQRVAQELNTKIGDLVDYQIMASQEISPNSRIVFMFDRIFVNEMIQDPKLSRYSCIIVDEAHERNINTDILLGMLKKACRLRPDLKVIITSATLDKELFSGYFNENSAIIEVPGQVYPVKIKYRLIPQHIDYKQEIMELLKINIIEKKKWGHGGKYEGHILIFTAGVDEINELIKKCDDLLDAKKYQLLPLHGQLLPEEQNLVFQEKDSNNNKFKNQKGNIINRIKVIFATRIAETSVTINNVSVVIDIGWDREKRYDPKKKMLVTDLVPISKSSAKQRAGRAGRTRSGQCIRLYSQLEYENRSVNKLPEIARINLDHAVLKLKKFTTDKILNFEFIERPPEENLKDSLQLLTMIGALDEKEQLTELGDDMTFFPIEPIFGRIMIEGVKRYCEEEVTKIICLIINFQNLYRRGFDEFSKEEAERKKVNYCDESGDFITLLNIFNRWLFIKQKHGLKDAQSWCYYEYLNHKNLVQANDLYRELKPLIEEMARIRDNRYNRMKNYKNTKGMNKLNTKDQAKVKKEIIKCMITGFFSNLCIFSGSARIGYTSIRHNALVQIHCLSSLTLIQKYPQWIICSEIMKLNYLAAKIVSYIDIEWIYEVIPIKYRELYGMKNLENIMKFNCIRLNQISTTILYYFLHKKHESIKQISEDYNIFFDIDFITESIQAFFIQEPSIIEPLLKTLLSKIREEFLNETYEFPIIGSTRAIIQTGAETKDVLLNDEFKMLKFNSSMNFKSQSEVSEYFSKFGKIEKITFCPQSECSFIEGTVIMTNKEDAIKAENYIKENFLGPTNCIIKYKISDSLIHIKGRIKISWGHGQSKKSGLVIYNNQEDADKAKKNMSEFIVDGRKIHVQYTHKSTLNLIVHNLNSTTDEYMLKKEFISFGCSTPPKAVTIFRDKESGLDDLIVKARLISYMEETIGIDKKYIVNFTLVGYRNNNKTRRKAFISFSNDNYAKIVCEKMNGLEGLIGNQRIYVKPHYVKNYKFNDYNHERAIKTYLNNAILDMKAKYSTKLKINFIRGKNKLMLQDAEIPGIKIVALNTLVLNEVVEIFNEIFLPSKFVLNKFSQAKALKTKDWQQILCDFRNQWDINIAITKNSQKQIVLKIFGEPPYRKLAIEKLGKFFSQEIYDTIKINFKGKCVQDLLQKNGYQFWKIQDEYYKNNVELDISLIRKEIYIYGPKYILPKVESRLKEYLIDFKNSGGLIRQNLYCGLCNGEMIKCETHRLIICGHKFCRFCLEIQLKKAANSIDETPIVCEECDIPIALKDIGELVQYDIQKKIFSLSFKKFLKSTPSYIKCMTPSCNQIFRRVALNMNDWGHEQKGILKKGKEVLEEENKEEGKVPLDNGDVGKGKIFMNNEDMNERRMPLKEEDSEKEKLFLEEKKIALSQDDDLRDILEIKDNMDILAKKASNEVDFTCDICDKKYCGICLKEAHKDRTCKQNEYILELKKRTEANNQEVKQCLGCDILINNQYNAYDVLCERCESYWCWKCYDRIYSDAEQMKHHIENIHCDDNDDNNQKQDEFILVRN